MEEYKSDDHGGRDEVCISNKHDLLYHTDQTVIHYKRQ